MKSEPRTIPEGLQLRKLKEGKHARFLLTGSYAQLPEAYPNIFSIIEKSKLKIRDDFCIEKYLNNPTDTPEDELKTEILIRIVRIAGKLERTRPGPQGSSTL